MQIRSVLLLISLIFCSYAVAQDSKATSEQLGQVNFPTSCAPEAQPAFERGVALLHSFQYATADAAFADAAQKDPHCAMAYWGEAMSLYHQLWEWPSAADMKKGHELIEKAGKAGAKTERERLFIRAAAAFYTNNSKMDRGERQNAYSSAMAKLYQKFPQDGEAAAFYALSLLPGYHGEHAQSTAKAVSILKELFARQPDHPGAAHYLIHATDSPELASQGLEAARRYAKVAPSSSHALHMPSHIFSRLGLWQDMIDSNLAAATAAEQATRSNKDDNEARYQLHAMKYLQYAYEQTGRTDAARQVIEKVKDVPGIKPEDISDDGNIMKALYTLETHQWDQATQLSPEAATAPSARMRVLWARTVAESRQGNKEQAHKDLENLHTALQAHHEAGSNSPRVMEAEAWEAFASGKTDEAVNKMKAATKNDEFGVDAASVPASEMLGDLLLELKRPAEALEAYEATLKQAPNRFNSLYGAGHAAELAGKEDQARQYYSALEKIVGPQSDRPELQYVKVFLAKKVNAGVVGH